MVGKKKDRAPRPTRREQVRARIPMREEMERILRNELALVDLRLADAQAAIARRQETRASLRALASTIQTMAEGTDGAGYSGMDSAVQETIVILEELLNIAGIVTNLHIPQIQQPQPPQQQQIQQTTRIPHVIPAMEHHPVVNSGSMVGSTGNVVQQQVVTTQTQMQPRRLGQTHYIQQNTQSVGAQSYVMVSNQNESVAHARGAPRVMRGGTSRMYLQQTTAGEQSYVMQSSQPVRVMPAQREIQGATIGGQRRTQAPQPGTVAAMMMPRGGGVSQLRTIPRLYQEQTQRINVMNSQNPQQQMRQPGTTTTHLITTSDVGGLTDVPQPVNTTGRALPTLDRTVEQIVVQPQQQQQQAQQQAQAQVAGPSQSVAQVVLAPPPTSSTNSAPIQPLKD